MTAKVGGREGSQVPEQALWQQWVGRWLRGGQWVPARARDPEWRQWQEEDE